MLIFSSSFPAIPVHIHSVEQTMDECTHSVEGNMSSSKQCLTYMEPLLSMDRKSINISALAKLQLLKIVFRITQ